MDKRQAGEIDLLELFAGFFKALKRNLRVTIITPLGGVVAAVGISLVSPDVFESSLLIETSLLTDSECQFLFEQLDRFGVIPGLTPDQDDQVKSFEFKVTKNARPLVGDNTYMLDQAVYLEVTARVANKAILPVLQKALVDFIDKSASVQRQRKEREKFFDAMIKKIDTEILAMDEVKKHIDGKTQATFLNPSDLFASSIKLHEKRTEYEIMRAKIKSVHLLKGFDTLTIDAGRGVVISAIIGFAAGFGILCFAVFIRFFLSLLKRYETTH